MKKTHQKLTMNSTSSWIPEAVRTSLSGLVDGSIPEDDLILVTFGLIAFLTLLFVIIAFYYIWHLTGKRIYEGL